VPVASLRRKPRTLSLEQAAAVGLTYLVAWLGLVEYAQIGAGETLVVIGANGGVGGAVAQIGKWRGARVIGTDRSPLAQAAPAARAYDDFLVVKDRALEIGIREVSNGRGADVVFDTVGGAMFEPALKSLTHRGRLLEISSAGDRRVSFDLLDFYHNESRLFGVDTRVRDAGVVERTARSFGALLRARCFSATCYRSSDCTLRWTCGVRAGGPRGSSRANCPRSVTPRHPLDGVLPAMYGRSRRVDRKHRR
jgi:NADPH:quinone reductase-like Zn-dependent oxidoreductase